MARKLFRTGNSTVVSIPKEVLEGSGLTEGAEVQVRATGMGRIEVSAMDLEPFPGVDEEFSRQVAEFIDQYRPALEKLAR